MEKLWNKYSYAILLLVISSSFAFILSIQNGNDVEDQYMKVTVSAGDSLWKISDQYSEQLSISKKEFVNWVKKHNNIEEHIYPGDEIIIPVSKDSLTSQYASAPEK